MTYKVMTRKIIIGSDFVELLVVTYSGVILTCEQGVATPCLIKQGAHGTAHHLALGYYCSTAVNF